jgi:protein TonB
MFEQSLIMDAARRRNPWSFAASITAQSLLVGAALVLPMMHIARLDTKPPDVLFLPRAIGRPEVVKHTSTKGAASLTVVPVDRVYKVFQAPTRIPDHVATGPDVAGPPEVEIGSSGSGIPIGIPGGLEMGQKELPLPPPPAPTRRVEPVAAPQGPVRISSGIQEAKLVFGPKPAYPVLAKQARISGTVRLAAQISVDGHIRDLHVMSGHPMLVTADGYPGELRAQSVTSGSCIGRANL